MRALGVFFLGILIGGCADKTFGELPKDLCWKQHIQKTGGDEMAVCDELYPSAPFVHLPKDESDRAFAGVENSFFVTPQGAKYSVSDQNAEVKRHGVLFYELQLDGDSLSDYRPALSVSEAAFFSSFLGRTAEGTITRRIAVDRWEDQPSLPVRVDIASEPAAEPSPGSSYDIVLSIANLEQAVTAADGTCLPALSSYGAEGTFASGVSVELRGYRDPSMHFFGDDEFVVEIFVDGETIGTMMSPYWYRGPMDLVRDTLEPTEPYSGAGHATPGYVPSIELDFVDGGGEPCTP